MKKPIIEIVEGMGGIEAIDFIIDNIQGYIVDEQEIAKIKAKAVRDAIEHCVFDDGDIYTDDLEQYANDLENKKVEQGE